MPVLVTSSVPLQALDSAKSTHQPVVDLISFNFEFIVL